MPWPTGIRCWCAGRSTGRASCAGKAQRPGRFDREVLDHRSLVFGLYIGDHRNLGSYRYLWFIENDLQEWLAECVFGERGSISLGNTALENEMQNLKAITHKEE
ncbi:hypothetical protein [Salinicola aestuarinus]|uniref:hypothetical protein n=1 Tax=Salinicola aestuarinus TaxID=1949082 RepID=UPI00165FA419|nr:hypothetical protein [Salinicola aestuarinus]